MRACCFTSKILGNAMHLGWRSLWFDIVNSMVGFTTEDLSPPDPFDIDLDSLWTEFDEIPSLPPCIGSENETGNGFSFYHQNWLHASITVRPACVEYFFDAGSAVGRYSFWTGPDPLCPDTCADDLFLYITTFLLVDNFQWLEFRLCKLHIATQEVLAQYPFFLPRVESLLGNLQRTRAQIEEIISQNSLMESKSYRFQLIICPISEHMNGSSGAECASIPDYVRPASTLEPQYFVKNIAGSFQHC